MGRSLQLSECWGLVQGSKEWLDRRTENERLGILNASQLSEFIGVGYGSRISAWMLYVYQRESFKQQRQGFPSDFEERCERMLKEKKKKNNSHIAQMYFQHGHSGEDYIKSVFLANPHRMYEMNQSAVKYDAYVPSCGTIQCKLEFNQRLSGSFDALLFQESMKRVIPMEIKSPRGSLGTSVPMIRRVPDVKHMIQLLAYCYLLQSDEGVDAISMQYPGYKFRPSQDYNYDDSVSDAYLLYYYAAASVSNVEGDFEEEYLDESRWRIQHVQVFSLRYIRRVFEQMLLHPILNCIAELDGSGPSQYKRWMERIKEIQETKSLLVNTTAFMDSFQPKLLYTWTPSMPYRISSD